MGNIFSKKNKVLPLVGGESSSHGDTLKVPMKGWYRGLWCCGGSVATVGYGNRNNADLDRACDGKSSSDSDLARDSCLELQGYNDDDDDDDVNEESLQTLQVSLPMKLRLPSDTAPLPKIGDEYSSEIIRSGLTVLKDMTGKTRSIAYDVELVEEEILNRPQSTLSMGNPTHLPKRLQNRLPSLPHISQAIIQRRFVELS